MLTADAMLREANMGMLDKLKIVALAKQVKGTVEQERRKKLAEQLTEQLKLAEAALGGVTYQRTKAAWDTDAEGNRYRVQRPVKLRQWWTVGDGGTVQFGVRYGAVPLQLQPGKTAVGSWILRLPQPWDRVVRSPTTLLRPRPEAGSPARATSRCWAVMRYTKMVYSFDQGRGANQPVLVQVNINYCLISEA
jgi:hypothetical protein